MFETALAAAEDETDVVAAKIAKEEAVADLAEFDEAIPIDEQNDIKLSKADMEVQALEKQVINFYKFYLNNQKIRCLKDMCVWTCITIKIYIHYKSLSK